MDLHLRRKLTLRANGSQIVFVKKKVESLEHVLMKAFLWALYGPDYADITVEIPIGDKYKPDVVSLDERGEPRFWGEAGKVGVDKLASLMRRFPETHFALAKWATRLEPHVALVREAIGERRRHAPVDLLSFPPDSAERFIDADGVISLSRNDVDFVRIDGG